MTAPRLVARSWAFLVALLGTIVVTMLLLLPIYTLGPGDDEEQRCGTAFAIDLDRWHGYPEENYFDRAQRVCSGERIDRIAQAVGVQSVTTLLVTALLVRRRVPSASP